MLADRIQEWGEEFKREGLSKGLQEGRQQGLQEGRQQGETQLLLRQLQRRFGEVPDWVRARLREATLEQLESWGERLFDAGSLDVLFSEELPPRS